MSLKRKFDSSSLPPRWLNCPRKANSVIDKFVAFKVPLKSSFDKNVPLENRFNMKMLLESVKKNFNVKLGLIIDLTNTDRYYDSETEVKQEGIKYYKLNCKGRGETPDEEKTKIFVKMVQTFINQHPLEYVGVHCTHGFNRTGFLICAYLVENLDYSIDSAVAMFAEARPPGIYKQDYLNELFRRYGEPSMKPPNAPPLPTWESEDEPQQAQRTPNPFDDLDISSDEDFNNQGTSKVSKRLKKNNGRESNKLNPKFAEPDLAGIETCTDPEEITRVRQEVQAICGWNGAGFPGAQPVSMDQKNIQFLYQQKYRVSWKADGTRYLMYINGRDKIYMLDRDNSVFKVENLTFPFRKDLDRHITTTLLDGEFVMDLDPTNNQKIPRFLIYDVVKFENDEVGKVNFDIRLTCINKEIISARHEAIKCGKINKQIEPFSVRQKDFYPIRDTRRLLSPDFAKNITHGIDGLIYQPVDEQYKGGRCDSILKWKPPSMNSVDFKLIVKEINNQPGMLPVKIGELYVNGFDGPFSTIQPLNKTLRALDGKIIECRWFQERWDFMRERVDKSYPNHYNTAMAVCESIKHPITEEILLQTVTRIDQMRAMNSMPAPNFIPPHPR